MRKLLLLLVLAIIFVGCTRMNDEAPDNAEAPMNDNVILPEESTNPAPLPNAETPAAAEPKITLDEAKRIAFEDAGVNEEDVYGLETDVDLEGNRRYYEIDFKSGNYEYEYEIDAESGKILKKNRERD